MQRGFLSRLIGRALTGTHIPAQGRVSVVLNHLRHCSKLARTMSYTPVERGQPNTFDYRIYYEGPNGNIISPFHDIPLKAKHSVFNMVVEIPRWTNAKMEISKDDKLNPIKQDVKKGALRYVKNIFPHHGYIWNYGALPQTWEDPGRSFGETGTSGDNDPLDVCEIGQKVHQRGAVIQVKILGTMCLIDEGETDWKIIAIDVTDPLADSLNDVGDINREMPGFLRATYEWFKYYKKPDGKPENHMHWEGECKNKEFALHVVEECHDDWKKLMSDPKCGKVSCINTSVGNCPDLVTPDEATAIVNEWTYNGRRSPSFFERVRMWVKQRKAQEQCSTAAPVDNSVDKWYYVIPQ